jgi:RNA polymerase sigma factor (sigma-70 family)
VEQTEQFSIIYKHHFNKVFRLCNGYFNGDEDLAKDVTQDIFIKVWQHLKTFRNESLISTWIYRISVNTCLLHLRKTATKKEVKSQTIIDIKVEEYSNAIDDQLKKMYECIQQLDEMSRLIILMILDGLGYLNIAEVTGISEETLRVKIHRIKKQLSNCVKL